MLFLQILKLNKLQTSFVKTLAKATSKSLTTALGNIQKGILEQMINKN